MQASEDHVPVPERVKAELVAAGFQPRRFGRSVRAVRRIMWPFMRPYMFYLLERMQRLSVEQGHLPQADAGSPLDQRHDEHVAVVNRLAVLEDEMERMTAALALGGSPADTVPPPSEPGPAQATAGHLPLSIHVLDEGLFVLKTGDLISETAIRTGHWDPHILRAADRVAALRPEGRGVDAGAQFGLLTVPLARRFARVTSFEPNRYSASLLVANVALNGLSDRVAICRDALFSRATQLSLAQPSRQEIPLSVTPEGQFDPAATSNIGAYSFAERGTQIYESNAVALDSLALDDVAFLKIDVQGADGEVVMGALATIERCRPWVAFEWEEALSRNFGTSLAQVIQAMEARGYRVAVLHRHNEKQADYLAFPSEQSGHTAGLLPDAA